MTLTYTSKLAMVKVDTQIKVVGQAVQAREHRQTDRQTDKQTDATKRIISPALQSIIN